MLYRSIGAFNQKQPRKRTLGQFSYLRPTVTDLHPTGQNYIRFQEICQPKNKIGVG